MTGSRVAPRRTVRRLQAVLATAATLAALLVATSQPGAPARADTAPRGSTPATVAANALPTVQQDGVVWAQVVVRNAVYATGRFAETWPAGAAHTAANETARPNLLAYDIRNGGLYRTGVRLNGQGLGIAASPDTSRVYVVGDFTSVNGVTRNRIVAINTYTGKVDPNFHPSVNGRVRAVVATNSTVYFGGNFSTVNGIARKNLASVSASNGALTTWKPTADDGLVQSLILTPDTFRVIVGGRFTTLDHQPANGMGSLGAGRGQVLPWHINSVIHDGGGANSTECGITDLKTDGRYIYGSGFAYQTCGNFEGTFAADPDTGDVVWINDCHGDTYGVYPYGKVLYSIGHVHDCSATGQFPNSSTYHHALAWTTYPTGMNSGPDAYQWNYSAYRDSQLLQWYPTLAVGKVTGLYQAAWSIVGNGKYLSLGGEFPTVNGFAQAGLVRFATRDLAPNTRGPVASVALNPRLSASGRTVTISWGATWDQDNQYVGYHVYRDGSATAVCYVVKASNFWTFPAMSCADHNVPPGSHKYVVRANDYFNNQTTGSASSITVQ